MFHEWSFFDPTDVIFKLEMFNFAQYVVDGVIGKVKIAKSTLATLIYTCNVVQLTLPVWNRKETARE